MLSNASILRKAATTAIRRSMATEGECHCYFKSGNSYGCGGKSVN